MRLILFSLFFFTGFLQLSAQISRELLKKDDQKKPKGSSVLDDSTKQIYGPTTVLLASEESIKLNKPKWNVLDTSIINFHRYQFIASRNNTFQNLGNIGTAITSIYPQTPDIIGARLGFTLYDEYFLNPSDIPIVNTKSPYSKFGIVWGGQGRSMTEAIYTRNIDERSNVGFSYKGLFIDKQIERERRGDRNALGTYYNFYGNYSTKNGKYFITGNFSRNRHTVDESGGVLLNGQGTFQEFFEENRQINLSATETSELRTNYHVYQQYKVNEQVQLYHVYDRYKQWNDFTNTITDGLETDSVFFSPVVVDSVPIRDFTKIIYRQHEVGIKGDIGKTFYSFYYRGREVNLDYKYIEEDSLAFDTYYLENYAGFNLRFGNDSLSYITVSGEYLSGENYRLNAELRNTWFFARGSSARYLPSYTQRAYLGRHNGWSNNFESTISTKVEAGLDVNLVGISIQPTISYNLITDYVYFKEASSGIPTLETLQPVQESGDISVSMLDLKLNYRFLKKLMLTGQVIYSNVSGGSADAIQLPEFLVNTQLSYNNILFDGNLQLQTGIDFHQRSAYFANAYDPSAMQFYVQEEFQVNSFPVIDIFANLKINRGRVFLKFNNVYELIKGTGYFMTPFYPAQETILDFGIDWMLFD